MKPVAGSYLTSLWDHFAFKKNKIQENKEKSIVHILSKHFTIILLSLALITTVYWAINDPSKIISSVSAMLIVACPCALLLSATFTNGILLRIFSANGLFLRNASVIEQMGKIDHIVFDKTGTLTENNKNIEFKGLITFTVSRNWYLSCPSGVNSFHMKLCIKPAQYIGTA